MTTSDLYSEPPRTVFVWIWLPETTEPVVCGRLDEDDEEIWFTYARSYKARENAVAIFAPELPLNANRPTGHETRQTAIGCRSASTTLCPTRGGDGL